MVLYLDIAINQQAVGQLVQVLQRGTDFSMEADALRRMHVLNSEPPGSQVVINRLEGVSVHYDMLAQRLAISVPPEWLPLQRLSEDPPVETPTHAQSTGWLMNYDLYSTQAAQSAATSLWTEQRYFSPRGIGFNTGVARLRARPSSTNEARGYVRYDTRWTRTDMERATETLYGDIVSGALPWTSAVRLGGVQWARNFRVRPDLVTYPLPEFSGIAAVPSAVDLFVNGFRSSSHRVAPGPFTLGDMPVVSGAGTASVVTTDALGRQVYTTIPFYVNRELLRPGLVDYSASLGALRRDYGVRSFAYGRPVAMGVYRQGLSDRFTLEAQAQWGQGLQVAGVGGLATLGLLGTANASLTRGRTQRSGSGWHYSSGWQYSAPGVAVSLQQSGRTAGFGDASTYADDGYALPRRTRQATVGWSLGNGSVTTGWLDLRSADRTRSRIALVGYSAPVHRNTYLSVTAGRTLETGETQVRLQLTYLPGDSATAQAAVGRSGGSTHTHLAVQRNMPTEGGVAWNLSHSPGGGHGNNSQASLQYRNSHLTLQGGVGSTRSPVGPAARETSTWLGLTGSVGSLDGYLFAANRVHDSFALVSTHGMADVPILYENQLVGHTNAQGYLLVPGVTAFYPGRYAVDPLTLPPDVDIPSLERRVSAPRGMGMLVELPVLKLRTATVTLVNEQGEHVPAGSAVLHTPGGVHTVVGWDGVVYLTALHPHNVLAVRTPQGTQCQAQFAEADYVAQRDLTVPCTSVPPGAAVSSTP